MQRLGFGLMRLPMTDAKDRTSIDQNQVNEMVDYFLSEGFTYFDTAYPYHNGMSEKIVKSALADRHPRDAFTVTSKMPVWLIKSYEDYQKYFEEQLNNCGVEYFDYYLLHALDAGRYKDTMEKGGFQFVQEMKKQGKIKHLGFSFHDEAKVLDQILTEHPEMEYVQLQINYIDWEDASIQSRKCYETAVRHQRQIIVMEPVKGGALANIPEDADKLLKSYHPDLSAASWAIRYAASLDRVVMVLSGMSNIEQVKDNAAYMKHFLPLNQEEHAILKEATDVIHNSIAIGCTTCEYCVAGCPMNIPIPKYFTLYNNQHLFGNLPSYVTRYQDLIKEYGKASDCINCGQCEEQCPQQLQIIDYLKDVASVFE